VSSESTQRLSADPIRVIIVEDDRATREGQALLIAGAPSYQCVATFRSVEEALGSAGHEIPNVLLLDVRLPGMPGSEGIGLLKQKYPAVQILMPTINADDDSVFESICRGACGYLLKNTTPARLLEQSARRIAAVLPCRPKSRGRSAPCFRRPPAGKTG